MTNDQWRILGGNEHHGALHSSFVIRHSSFAFSAVLLAGGRSSRMGRDKALLPLPDGRPLWRRQLDDVLRPLGPAELFFSGPARPDLPADVRVLPDAQPGNLGPLAGVAVALAAMSTPLLLVLAVDLPAMKADFFRDRLFPRCAPGRGAVPCGEDGFFEGLGAIYPAECRVLLESALRGDDLSVQTFVRHARDRGLVDAVEVEPRETSLFTNWNTPADVGPW